jgi:hypothetical protein
MVNLVNAIPLLLSALIGFLLGLVTWGALRMSRKTDDVQPASGDDVLLGLAALAAFALGAFLTYALLGIGL